MMRWDPSLAADETVLVSCSVRPRVGKRFDVVLTDRRLLHSNQDGAGIETVEVALGALQQVALHKRRPWVAWAIGAVAACIGIGWAVAFTLRLVNTIGLEHVAVVTFAGFIGIRTARPLWTLEWSTAGGRYRLAQPFTLERVAEAEMSATLQEIGRLLANPMERASRANQARAERRVESEDGERRLCSDGSCTGLVADGRCRVCGRY